MNHIKTPALWHEFYRVAALFRDAAPWNWMDESNVFGIKDPETGKIGWCTIMGAGGEHCALGIYRDVNGLDSYLNLREVHFEYSESNPEFRTTMLIQDCWMIAFQDADMVSKESKKHFKALGLSFRGKGQWIDAESYDPGLMPYYLDEKDLPYLTLCLHKALEITQGMRDGNVQLSDEAFTVWTPKSLDLQTEWERSVIDELDYMQSLTVAPLELSPDFKASVKGLPAIQGALVLSSILAFQLMEVKPKTRPFYPLLLMGIQYGSGFILSQEVVRYPDLRQVVEGFLLKTLQTIKGRPNQIAIHHEPLFDMLDEPLTSLGIEVVLMDGEDPNLLEIVEAMSGFM